MIKRIEGKIMIKMKVTLPGFEFDLFNYTKTAKSAYAKTMRQAVRIFVRAAITRVPIDTGMARGSFLNISRLIKNLNVQSGGGRTNVKYYDRRLGLHGVPKTPELGAQLSTQPENVFNFDKDGNLISGKTYKFNYNTLVWHYNINEFLGRAPSAPWFSYAIGLDAAKKYLEKQLPKNLPRFSDFLIVTQRTVDFSGQIRTNRVHLSKSGITQEADNG